MTVQTAAINMSCQVSPDAQHRLLQIEVDKMVDMSSQTFDRIQCLHVWWTVLEGNSRQVLVEIPLQLCGVVNCAVMIDGECRVAVGTDDKEFSAEEGADEATII